jgi:LacI family transcriptional regulator
MRHQAPLQPTVLIGGNPIGLRLPQVREDDRAAGALGARHFIERGHKHFAWITPHVASHVAPVVDERLEGFRAGLQDAGFQCHILEATAEFRRQQSWLVEKLRKMPRPLAIFALDDQVASETIETCLAEGWRIPEEIAILGVGNIEIACKCSHVPISSVDMSEEDVGRRAAMLLDKLMHGGKPPPHATVIAPSGVIVRQSTDSLILTNPVSRAAVAFIKANLNRALSLEQVAKAASISRRTLYRLFEHDLRLTPADFILQARLEKARRELSIPGKKIAAVAAQCGFGSASTLTRLFRKYEGMTTEAWQKANAIIRVQ